MNLVLKCICCYRDPEELVNANEKSTGPEVQQGEEDAAVVNKENVVNEPEEKEPEDKVTALFPIEFPFLTCCFVLPIVSNSCPKQF